MCSVKYLCLMNNSLNHGSQALCNINVFFSSVISHKTVLFTKPAKHSLLHETNYSKISY